jgi:hypothetical protein
MQTRRQFLGRASAAISASILSAALPNAVAATDAPLLFGMGIHIEPFGALPSPLAGPVPPASSSGLSYFTPGLYQRHCDDLRLLAAIAEAHGGRLTIQAQTPFTRVALARGEPVFADLEARGHEIALHFHEDAHLGRHPERLPVAVWAAVMADEISVIRALGARSVRSWSGGNLYPGVLEAAALAGLSVMSDYKNPRTQSSDAVVMGIHPWRPAGGPSEIDLSAFARHDPAGPIVYLPTGRYRRTDYASSRRSPALGGDVGYFQFLRESVVASIAAARADRVNVFHLTVHPGEFQSSPHDPHTVLDQFLTDTIDPAVEAGTVRWATFSEMADAFLTWETTDAGRDPRAGEGGAAAHRLLPLVPQGVPRPGGWVAER